MVGILGSAVAAFLLGVIGAILDARKRARAINEALRQAGPSFLPTPVERYRARN